MIYNIAIFDDVSNAIGVGLRSFAGWIIAQIFTLIEYLYKVFDYVAMAEILDNDYIQTIYARVGMILGIFMVFKLVFSLVNSLISPDKLNDKKSGAAAIVQRSVIAIVLLGITPTIFNEAFKIQRLLVGNTTGDNVLYKLISNRPIGSDTEIGHALASDLYLSFYTDNEEPKLNNGTIDKIYDTNDDYYDRFKDNDYNTIYNDLRENNITFVDTIDYLSIRGTDSSSYVIEFNWIVLLIVGCFVVWMLAMYCVQVGIRVVQLAYLQLIAPIPILSYISDPDGTFKKWIKQCTTTYLDLFFRLALIYFIMTMISDVLEQFDAASGIIFESTGIPSDDWFTLALVKIIIILGLLLFAKRAPELIKDLFPNLGGGVGKFSFGLSPKKEIFDPISSLAKSAYNTPLGWGIKGAKALGTAIDRKKYNLPKPRGKFGQAVDKWLPGRAEALKNRHDIKDRKELYEEGMQIYSRNGGTLTANDFSNKDYQKSWQAVKNAKDALKTADQDLDYWRNEVAQGHIDTTDTNYQSALKNQKAASARLEAAKRDHDNNRKIYVKDARKEDAFGYYKDMQYGSPASRASSPGGSGGTTPGGSGGTTPGGSGGTTPGGSGGTTPGGSGGTTPGGSGGTTPGGSGGTTPGGSGGTTPGGSGGTTPGGSNDSSSDDDIYISEQDIEDAYDKLYELTGNGASQEEIDEQLNWIDDITKENESNLEDAYSKLYELTGSGASQEEIDAQIKKINDIKSGEIK